MTDVHVAIISAGRMANVPAMEAQVAELGGATWYVPADQVGDYGYVGATDVVGSGGLCASRNAAMDAARACGLPCLQLSDDLKGVAIAHGTTRDKVEPATLTEVVERMAIALRTSGAQLAGVAPTANPYFSRQRIHPTGFVVGDLHLTAAGCPLRFDERLPLKEDYDFTCQHLATYGHVARLDYVLASFAHRTNKGGAVAVRTPELEQFAISRLVARWPAHIRPNPRRPNEVLLRWKPDRPTTLPT